MRYFLSFLLIVAVVYFGFLFFFDYSIESPNYEVTMDLGNNVEIREYESYYQAYVSYENGEYENQAFRKLFNFISGENTVSSSGDSESIDMTAPVKLDMTAPVKLDMTAPVKDYGFDGMAFVMPSDFDVYIIPNDSKIEIQKVEGQKLAVIRYSGFMSESKMNKKYLELIAVLDQNSIAYEKGAVFAAYNGPYTLPFLRRNEVWIQIK